MLRLVDVSKRYGGLKAVAGVSLRVDGGEITAVIGPNGAGKTTLFSLIAGSTVPGEGSVIFRGRDITGLSPSRICRLGIGRTFQVVRPFRGLSVRDHLRAATLFGGHGVLSEKEIDALLDLTELRSEADREANSLTLAACKRLEIARAMATGARLLLLDETLAGLTPEEITRAVQLIQRIRGDGRTILLIEHVLAAVRSLCERVVVMDRGLVIADGPPEEVFACDTVRVAYLGD